VCESITPLGMPVVPEVYMITATSSAAGGVGLAGLALPAAMSSSAQKILKSHYIVTLHSKYIRALTCILLLTNTHTH
jgi:hypothetical protein